MDILKNNDSNYIAGVLIAFYTTYVLHNNIDIHIHPIFSLLILVLITVIAHKNIVLATILSIGFIVSH